ncbi:MAG: hypothetical protein HFJ05_03205 [Eubacterium sp.]|nr:hypothetical protein [Eubacterium sp.]
MNSRKLFNSIGGIEDRFIDEASPKEKMQPTKRHFSIIRAAVAAAIILVISVPVTAFAIEAFQYNAAVTFLTSLGIEAEDLSDYSRREVIDTAKTYDAGESNAKLGVTGDKLLEAEKTVTVLQADYPKYNTAEELVEYSNLVFTGTVKNIEYQMIDVSTDKEPDEDTGFVDDEEMPYTLYTIDVDKVYKGSIESSTIIVRRVGGIFGSDEYIVENASEIAKGKKYLFVAKTYEDTYPSLLNADQSSYDMDAPQTVIDAEEKEIMLSDILKLF